MVQMQIVSSDKFYINCASHAGIFALFRPNYALLLSGKSCSKVMLFDDKGGYEITAPFIDRILLESASSFLSFC